MATHGPTSVSLALSSDAIFRNWAQVIHNALAAVGLVQTSDTGQINLATVLMPVTINTFAGYEIWRFDDPEQATRPIFIRLRYGIGSASNRQALETVIGSGSDGNGNLTGQIGAAKVGSAFTTEAAGNVRTCFKDGTLVLTSLGASSVPSIAFMIERIKNELDQHADIGVLHWNTPGSGNPTWQIIPYTGAIPAQTIASPPALNPNIGNGSKSGVETAFHGWTTFVRGRPYFITGALAYNRTDMTVLEPVSTNYFGSVKTYLGLGDRIITTAAGYGADVALAHRWE